MLSTLLGFDLPYRTSDGEQWNMGNGFPRLSDFMEHVIPQMTLNMHNPDLNGLVRQSNNGLPDAVAACSIREKEEDGGDDGGDATEEDGDEEMSDLDKTLTEESLSQEDEEMEDEEEENEDSKETRWEE